MKNQPMYVDEVSTDKGRPGGSSLDQGGVSTHTCNVMQSWSSILSSCLAAPPQ